VLHRITRGYALAALSVPVLGIATAVHLRVLGESWVLVSTALTAVAGLLLALAVVPGQRRVLDALSAIQDGTDGGDRRVDDGRGQVVGSKALPRLAMVTGMFNLLWVTVVVLMILRPGSTTLIHP
jgi:hypothetical protein